MKKILMIYTAFHPENAIGSIRNTKIAKYLVREGYDITVISTADKLSSVVDPTLNSKELDKLKLIEIPYSKKFKKYFLKKRNEVKEAGNSITQVIKSTLLNLYLKEFFTFLRNLDWSRQVKKYLKNKKNDYDIIISGYPSYSSHKIARRLKNKDNLWIADFRDPMAYKSLNSFFSYFLHKKSQKKICKKADFIFYLSKQSLKEISKGIKKTDKFIYIPNGFDVDDLAQLSQLKSDNIYGNSIFKICYVGSLYGGKRDLSILFENLAKIIKTNEDLKNKIEFHYAGKDFVFLENQFSRHNFNIKVINHGYVNRLESLNIQKNSDLIVINTWNTLEDQGIITGKIFEAFLFKKNILGIINGNLADSELKQMIYNSNLGHAYEEADGYINEVSLENYLVELIEMKHTGFKTKNYNKPNDYYISLFDYNTIVKTIQKIIDKKVF